MTKKRPAISGPTPTTETLDTILQRISPLPYRAGILTKTFVLQDEAGTIFALTGPAEKKEPGVTDTFANTVYLRHAANHLPKVVEALRVMLAAAEADDTEAEFLAKFEAAEAALQAAETVSLDSDATIPHEN